MIVQQVAIMGPRHGSGNLLAIQNSRVKVLDELDALRGILLLEQGCNSLLV